MSYSSFSTVKTVAQREIALVLKSKGIMVSLGLVLVLLLAAITIMGFINKSGSLSNDRTLAVVNTQPEPYSQMAKQFASSDAGASFGFEAGKITVTELGSKDEATEQVAAGEINAAVIHTTDGYEFLYNDSPDRILLLLATAVSQENARTQALLAIGADPQEFLAEYGQYSQVTPVALQGNKAAERAAEMPRAITMLAAVGVMFFFVMLFAGNVAGRVASEKSSRVVEMVLAAVRPLDFLTGKLVANLIFGLVGSIIIFGIGFVALQIAGLMPALDFDFSMLPVVLVAFVLAMLLFGSLYAAAGSLVSRSEDLQASQMPVLLLSLGAIYAPTIGLGFLDGELMMTLAWIPPFSLTVAPMQYAVGNMSLVQLFMSFGLTLLVVIVLLLLAARIYRNAILHNGARMSWVAALKGSK